jgi:RNA polymerase sigma factor (sigma-70 family)
VTAPTIDDGTSHDDGTLLEPTKHQTNQRESTNRFVGPRRMTTLQDDLAPSGGPMSLTDPDHHSVDHHGSGRVDTAGVSDAVMIERSRTDRDHFGGLYERYAPMLFRYAGQRVGPELAEDVVAETFLAAFRRRDRYDLRRPDARPWLFGILTREISRHRRAERSRYRTASRVIAVDSVDGPADRVAADVTARAARRSLAAALPALSAGDRDVLLLVAWADLSYGEVAQALDIPIGTVRSRLSRARRVMREALGNTDPTRTFEEPR